MGRRKAVSASLDWAGMLPHPIAMLIIPLVEGMANQLYVSNISGLTDVLIKSIPKTRPGSGGIRRDQRGGSDMKGGNSTPRA